MINSLTLAKNYQEAKLKALGRSKIILAYTIQKQQRGERESERQRGVTESWVK